MRAVIQTDPGVIELNWMFLPTCVGTNRLLMEKMQTEMSEKFEGIELTEHTMDAMHAWVLDFIAEEMSIQGMWDYLDGLKFLRDG